MIISQEANVGRGVRRVVGKLNLPLMVLLTTALWAEIASAQEMLSIYRDYLPERLLKYDRVGSQISSLLEEESRLEPDLIYLQIRYYNASVQDTGVETRNYLRTLYMDLQRAKLHYLSMRDQWARREIEYVDSMAADPTLRDRAVREFGTLLAKPTDDLPHKGTLASAHRNLIDYFVLLYYKRGVFERYDSTTDYTEARNAFETKKRDSIIRLPSGGKNSPAALRSQTISDVLSFWYLFDSDLSISESHQSETNVAETFLQLYKSELSTADLPSVHLGVWFIPSNFTAEDQPTFALETKGTTPGPVIQLKPNLSFPRYCISIGYRLYLKRYLDFLSYLDIDFAYAGTPKISPMIPTTTVNTYSSPRGIVSYDSVLFGNDAVLKTSLDTYFAKLSVPVLTISNSYFLEISLIGELDHLVYTFDYNYVRSLTAMYTPPVRFIVGSDSGRTVKRHQDYFFYPAVDIRARLFGQMSASISMYFKKITLSLEYGV